MVNVEVPDYLSTLFPSYVSQRTAYTLRTGSNLCLPFVTTEKSKNGFLYSTIKLCNRLSESTRQCDSFASFKNDLLQNLFYIPPPNKLYRLVDSYLSILNTRLTLKNCGLNYYLEDVFNCLLIFLRFAAVRTSMLASVMQNTGNILCRIPVTLSLSRQVDALLHGLPFLNFKTNAAVFAAVRIFIK